MSKRFAWVLKEDNTLERRYVQTGDLHGEMRVIEGGLQDDDKIAISEEIVLPVVLSGGLGNDRLIGGSGNDQESPENPSCRSYG